MIYSCRRGDTKKGEKEAAARANKKKVDVVNISRAHRNIRNNIACRKKKEKRKKRKEKKQKRVKKDRVDVRACHSVRSSIRCRDGSPETESRPG